MTPSGEAATQLVPAGFAEKAMASLMQLHSELMEEKERRVDLFRRLMEREQALAELKMYVKLLEGDRDKGKPGPAEAAHMPSVHATAAQPSAGSPTPPSVATEPVTAGPTVVRAQRLPPRPVSVGVLRPRGDGWKVW